MKVSDVAKLTGVTVRTLHYYDEIGLLPPSGVTSSGYRVYNDADLEVLQQILFFRELDFSLEDIRAIMQNPAYEKETALQKQKALLVQKRNRLDRLIALVDKTLKGERDMSFKQFDTTKIDEAKQQYAAEVKQRWGNTAAYAEYEKKSAGYNTVQQKMLDGEGAARKKTLHFLWYPVFRCCLVFLKSFRDCRLIWHGWRLFCAVCRLSWRRSSVW